jgi:hypothetical protein
MTLLDRYSFHDLSARSTRSLVNDRCWFFRFAIRYWCRARRIICRLISACSVFRRVKLVNLVVDVCDVHNKMDVIAKVVFEDATDDILSDIVAKNCGA